MVDSNAPFEPILTDQRTLIEYLSKLYKQMPGGGHRRAIRQLKHGLNALSNGQAAYVSLATDGLKLLPAPGGMVLIVRVQPQGVVQ